MAMRRGAFISILAAGAAAAAAAMAPCAASAQMMGQMGQMGMMGQMMTSQPPVNAPFGTGEDGAVFPSTQQRYAAKIMALKEKMQRLTVQDGGQLSDEHRASLQRELDGVNKSFGIKPAHG
jgi:hypothetical protein